jgi:hypothetical protein
MLELGQINESWGQLEWGMLLLQAECFGPGIGVDIGI